MKRHNNRTNNFSDGTHEENDNDTIGKDGALQIYCKCCGSGRRIK